MKHKIFKYPLNIYWLELKWQLCYIFFSFLCSVTIVFYRFEVFLIIESHPILQVGVPFFITTTLTDLLESIIRNCFFIAYVVTFPVFCYYIYNFLRPSMYVYQQKIFKLYLVYTFLMWFFLFLISHVFLLPCIFKFLSQWDLPRVIANIRLKEYVFWILQFYNCVNIIFHSFLSVFLFFLFTWKIQYSFLLFQQYKKHFLFFVMVFFNLILPASFTLQITFLIYAALLIEFIFFTICFRLKQAGTGS